MDEQKRLDQPTRDICERGVLGGILRWPAAMDDVASILTAEDFYHARYQVLFAAMLALYEEAKAIDAVSLADYLHKNGLLDSVKSTKHTAYELIGELISETPTEARALEHARRVRDDSLFRRLHRVADEIGADCEKPRAGFEETLVEAEGQIFAIGERLGDQEIQPFPDIVTDTVEAIERRMVEGRRRGLDTGLIDLDSISGGLMDGEVTIIASRPSCGKTSLALSIAANACKRNNAVLFCSLEQNRNELVERLLANAGGIDSQSIRTGTLTGMQIDALIAAKATVYPWPMAIDDNGQTLLRIQATARRLKRRLGIKMVVIDYLQLIEPDNPKASRQEQVASLSRRLKLLARELNIPVVVMAQLNRDVEGRTDHKPRLADLRESGAIEQDADVVLLLHRPDYYAIDDRPGEVDLIVAKNRNGQTGAATVFFRRDLARFENFANALPGM